jgi:hypothetical protein
MPQNPKGCTLLGLAALVLALPSHTFAVIERPLKLAAMIESSDQILFAKVTTWQSDRPAAVLTVEKSLKGGKAFERLPVRLKGEKETETKQLLARLAADVPIVIFVTETKGQYVGLAFTNGTWLQLIGKPAEGRVVWQFTHFEPYLRRTYQGTTAELTQLLPDLIAGKAKAPPLDPKVKPGIGPPLAEATGQ